MSYVRFSSDGSEVYVYSGSTGIVCCGCRLLTNGDDVVAKKPEEMIHHLIQHRIAKQFVPEYAVMQLWSEIKGAKVPNKKLQEKIRRDVKRFSKNWKKK